MLRLALFFMLLAVALAAVAHLATLSPTGGLILLGVFGLSCVGFVWTFLWGLATGSI